MKVSINTGSGSTPRFTSLRTPSRHYSSQYCRNHARSAFGYGMAVSRIGRTQATIQTPAGRQTVWATRPVVPRRTLHERMSDIGGTLSLRCGYRPTIQTPAATPPTLLPGRVVEVARFSQAPAHNLAAPAPREPLYMQFTLTPAPHSTPASKLLAIVTPVHPNTTTPPATVGTTVQVGFQPMVHECRTDGGNDDSSVCGAAYYPSQHVPDHSGDISST